METISLHHVRKSERNRVGTSGVKAPPAVFDDKEFDLDDGSAVYELEFEANGNEYEYDVNAVTGKVMKAEHDIAGQNDDRDDDMDGADDRDDDRDDDWTMWMTTTMMMTEWYPGRRVW